MPRVQRDIRAGGGPQQTQESPRQEEGTSHGKIFCLLLKVDIFASQC